jgi:hypothetical protein
MAEVHPIDCACNVCVSKLYQNYGYPDIDRNRDTERNREKDTTALTVGFTYALGLAGAMASVVIANQEKEKEELFKKIGDTDLCTICMATTRDTAFSPCGHYIGCWNCIKKIRDTTTKCPICRKAIKDILRLYKS